MKYQKYTLMLSLSFTLLLAGSRVQAAPGDVDTTFGTNGTTITDFGGDGFSAAKGLVIQPDGKIVVGGFARFTDFQFALARYLTDGTLDTSFDGDGLVLTDQSPGGDVINAIALQTDGKIVAATRVGETPNHGVIRYNDDGSVDTDFGTGGFAVNDFGGTVADGFTGIALQTDQKIVVVGSVATDFAVARFNTDGSPDASFDGDGKTTTNLGTTDDRAEGVAIQSDGKIVVVGQSGVFPNADFALVRYNSDGNTDSDFGTGGMVITDFGGGDGALVLAIQTDNKIVAGGITCAANCDLALARYNADGSLDTDFGNGGKVVTDLGNDDFIEDALAIQQNGKIVVGGDTDDGVNDQSIVVRYNSDGTVDTGFGTDGVTNLDLAPDADFVDALALQADGNIVIAGRAGSFPTGDFFVSRLIGDPPPSPPPSSSGGGCQLVR